MKDRELLDDICREDGCINAHCFLKELLLHSPLSDRQIMQIKLVDKFKYALSEKQGRNVNWNESFNMWVDGGYSKQYANFWEQNEYTQHVQLMYDALLQKCGDL